MTKMTANDEATGSTFSTAKLSYPSKAYGISNDEIQILFSAASPTAELAQKFMTSTYTKAKAYDELESHFMEYKRKTERPSHFMRLPSELRVQIYELVFYGVLDAVPRKAKRTTNRKVEARRAIIRHTKTAMAMAHTNSIIRVEALPVCRQLASAAQESVVAKLDQLNPEWMRFSA